MPAFSQLEDSSRGAAYSRALRLTALMAFPVSLGIFAVAPEVVALLPARWSGLVLTLRILALGTLVEPIAWYGFSVLSAQGRTRALFRLGLVLVPIGWAGSLLGALAGSAPWMATAAVVWSGAHAFGMTALVWRSLGLDRALLSRLALPLAAALAMSGAVRLVLGIGQPGHAVAGLFTGVGTGVLVYGLAVYTLLRADLRDLRELLRGAFRGRARSAVGR